MTINYGSVKSVVYHPDAKQPTAMYSAYDIDFYEASCWRSSESEGTDKKAEIEQEHFKTAFWLISLAALISLLVGVLCLFGSVKPRTAGTDQLDLATEGVPSQVEVTMGEVIQVLSVRR
jgi:hypothetical protein